jgi:lipoprotein NlpD
MHSKRTRATNPRAAAGMLLALLLSACASTPPAPVEDIALDDGARPRPVAAPEHDRPATATVATHKVATGDTLYSIAFKNGMDYRELARINRIDAPFRIYVGQELQLADPPSRPGVAVTAVPAAGGAATVTALPDEAPRKTAAATPPPNVRVDPRAVRSAPPPSNERIGTTPPPPGKPPPNSVAAAAAPTPATAPTIAPVPAPPPPATAAAVPPPDPVAVPPRSGALAPGANTTAIAAPGPSTPVLNSGGVSWRWPASGKVVGTFVAGDQTRQGVDIAGTAGANVAAAADGTVVYSGNGLLGYGELVIVKHSTSFLSAYGHNRKRLVKEGDAVKGGQVIAEMGGSNREMLHFEIRRNGKPVNPLEYLPAR